MVSVNDKILDFLLPSDRGIEIMLSDFNDRNVILYFYSKDNTKGCTCQALGYKELYSEFKKLNTEIIGISKDTIASHKKFKEKYELPFILVSDPEKDAIEKYDVLREKNMYGKKVMGVLRTSIVIKNGIIVKTSYNTNSKEDAINNLNYLKSNVIQVKD